MRTKAVQLLVNSALPPELRDYQRDMDAKSLGNLMADVARQFPEQFEGIAKRLSDVGRKASYLQGETLTLADTRPVIDRDKVYAEMDTKIDAARANAKNDEEFRKKRIDIWLDYASRLEKMTSDAALANGNNLAYSVMSGARGKPAQLKMMITTPALYTDAADEIVPLFIRNSFGDGLSPAEYLAGTYGARKSVLATKRATAKGGDLAKQMVQATAPVVVSTRDCGAGNGLDLEIDDSSLRGRILARETAGVPAGTVIDRHAMARFRKEGIGKIVARSPMTCQAESGVCAKCMGLNAKGNFPPIGEAVGITAAQAIGEPICLDGDTLVRMADWSERKIKDILPGEMVLGSDMFGNLTPVRVVNVYHNGPRECVKTVVRKGRGRKSETVELISTKEHKVLSSQIQKGFERKIQPIETLLPGRQNVYMSKGLCDPTYGVAEPHAGILGLLTGDGSYGGSNRGVSLSCYEPLTLKWADTELAKLGCYLENAAFGEYRINRFDTSGPRNIVTHPLKLLLMDQQMWGSTAHDKKLLKDIHTWDNASVARYIGGYIAADGWVTKKGVIGFSSVSRQLVAGIKDLLELRFGIYATRIVEKRKRRKEGGYYAASYEVCVSSREDILHFHRVIEIPGVKQSKLQQVVAVWPQSPYERGRFKVLSQTRVGIRDTWDIEVDNDTHLFVLCNSLIVSNTQQALNTKHQGGAAGGARREYSGFNAINQFVQTPELFPDRATVAREEGRVTNVRDAAQGGYYVQVNQLEHYVPPGYPLMVKPGDDVEAGDQLAEGLVDPGEIVELRGLGSGRRYYRDRLLSMLKDSGMPTDSRNVELLARSALDHVQIQDAEEEDDYLPDDVLNYSYLQSKYTPPVDAHPFATKQAVGRYLQAPALHYTVGTKVTNRMAKRLEDSGFSSVIASDSAPKFAPHMVRLRAASHNNPDWLASMHTSYLKKQLQDGAIRGRDTDVEANIHFAPRLAIGVDFGKNIGETGKF
jgi:hypothetical protein